MSVRETLDDFDKEQPMKRKTAKAKTQKDKTDPMPWLISGGFDPDCELCRALSEGNPEVFGDPLEVDGVEVREVLDLERAEELLVSKKSK